MLSDFLEQYSGFRSLQGSLAGTDYRNLSIDSRTIQPGQLFVALRGDRFDGHKYALSAVENGAVAAVVDASWYDANRMDLDAGKKAALIVVTNTLDFLQQLGCWHRKKFDFPVIGITGSNGKTTTRGMISDVLQQRFSVCQTEGNKNNHIGLPLMLLRLSAEHQVAVFEMGTNHPGEIGLLAGLAGPDAALITNIGKGHIGNFGSLKAVYREKTALFDAIRPDHPIFLNVDDPLLRNYPLGKRKAIRVGSAAANDVSGRILSDDQLGCVRFKLNESIAIQLAIPGLHNFQNALLAAAVGLHYGVDEQSIKTALESFEPASQRMQISRIANLLVIDDAYNANPDSMRAAVDYLFALNKKIKRRILVIGDMLELGDFAEEEHRTLGEYIAERSFDFVFGYGPLTRLTCEVLKERNPGSEGIHWYTTHEQLADSLCDIVRDGDALLVKGSRGMALENVLGALKLKNRTPQQNRG